MAESGGAAGRGEVAVGGSGLTLMYPPLVPMLVAATRTVPSGFVIETLMLQQAGPTFTLMRRPAVPAKVSFAFWPGIVVAIVTGAPPGVIAALASAGTS